MNGRLLLLVLVTAMFMAAWDGDQTAMQEALVRRTERQAAQIAASSREIFEQNPRTHQVTSVSHRKPVSSARQPDAGHRNTVSSAPAVKSGTPAFVAVNVPLPPAIAAGEYQAVSQAGVTVLITVPQGKSPNAPVRDFYVADSTEGERWFLVRIIR